MALPERVNQQFGLSVGRRNPTRERAQTDQRRSTVAVVSDTLDLDSFLERFRERAKAVRNRPMPPVEGTERARFKERMQVDFMDFAMIGDATATLEDGILTLSVDLRPSSEQ